MMGNNMLKKSGVILIVLIMFLVTISVGYAPIRVGGTGAQGSGASTAEKVYYGGYEEKVDNKWVPATGFYRETEMDGEDYRLPPGKTPVQKAISPSVYNYVNQRSGRPTAVKINSDGSVILTYQSTTGGTSRATRTTLRTVNAQGQEASVSISGTTSGNAAYTLTKNLNAQGTYDYQYTSAGKKQPLPALSDVGVDSQGRLTYEEQLVFGLTVTRYLKPDPATGEFWTYSNPQFTGNPISRIQDLGAGTYLEVQGTSHILTSNNGDSNIRLSSEEYHHLSVSNIPTKDYFSVVQMMENEGLDVETFNVNYDAGSKRYTFYDDEQSTENIHLNTGTEH
jgi:hypothetical protein